MDGSGYDSRNYFEAELKRAPRQILAHTDIISLTGDRVEIEHLEVKRCQESRQRGQQLKQESQVPWEISVRVPVVMAGLAGEA